MTTVVLVHPAGATAGFWEPQRAGLASRYRVVVPELPGRDGDGFTIDDAATLVAATLTEPAYLVGLSLGATIAVRAALARPDLVAGLVLSGGVARAPRALAVQRALMALLPARVLSAINAGAVPADYRERAIDAHARIGKPVLRAEMREWSRVDLRPELGAIGVRTLVLCGERDRANLAGARELADGIAGAELRTLPAVGHLWNWERPELFTSIVTGFVDHRS